MVRILQNDIQNGRSTPDPKFKSTKNVVIHKRLLYFVHKAIDK